MVHRLDREVSGLFVFAKHEAIAKQLIQQFKQRKPTRLYTAIVARTVAQDEGTFRSRLATAKNLDRYSTRRTDETELAITHYRVLRRMSDCSLVEVTLETGKRHQIRLHFADAGHPVLGDPRYKKGLAQHPRWIRKRIALHATTLGFRTPGQRRDDGRSTRRCPPRCKSFSQAAASEPTVGPPFQGRRSRSFAAFAAAAERR